MKISLPPLRERPDDVRVLAAHFLKQFAEKCGRPGAPRRREGLAALRGLSLAGQRARAPQRHRADGRHGRGRHAPLEDIPLDIRASAYPRRRRLARSESGAPLAASGEPATLRDLERAHIERVLSHTAGNKKEAARILGIDRSTLYAKLKVYGLESKEETGDGD